MRFDRVTESPRPPFAALVEGGSPRHGVPVFSARSRDFEACPIPGDLVEGAPAARVRDGIRSLDGRFASGLWDCSAGSFAIRFGSDELVHILEGEVIVHDPEASFVLRAGDVALFREGFEAVWEVPRYVRKLWVHRHREVPFLVRVRRRLALRTRLRGLATRVFGPRRG